MKIKILIFLVLGALASGCYNDNYTELFPANSLASGCDTVSPVSYSSQISTLLNNYCVGCHSANIANGNVKLDSYSGAMTSAESGQMLNSLLGQGGNPQMPPNSKLDACSIREVQLWIQNSYAQ